MDRPWRGGGEPPFSVNFFPWLGFLKPPLSLWNIDDNKWMRPIMLFFACFRWDWHASGVCPGPPRGRTWVRPRGPLTGPWGACCCPLGVWPPLVETKGILTGIKMGINDIHFPFMGGKVGRMNILNHQKGSLITIMIKSSSNKIKSWFWSQFASNQALGVVRQEWWDALQVDFQWKPNDC